MPPAFAGAMTIQSNMIKVAIIERVLMGESAVSSSDEDEVQVAPMADINAAATSSAAISRASPAAAAEPQMA